MRKLDICYRCEKPIKNGDHCSHSDGEPTHAECCKKAKECLLSYISDPTVCTIPSPDGRGRLLVHGEDFYNCGGHIP